MSAAAGFNLSAIPKLSNWFVRYRRAPQTNLTPRAAQYCWGDNTYGQLRGVTGPWVRTLSAARFGTCAVKPDHSGVGPAVSSFSAWALGSATACRALALGAARRCRGFGQLARARRKAGFACDRVPQSAPPLLPRTLPAGPNPSPNCPLRNPNETNTQVCWGEDKAALTPPSDWGRLKLLVAGAGFSCAALEANSTVRRARAGGVGGRGLALRAPLLKLPRLNLPGLFLERRAQGLGALNGTGKRKRAAALPPL